MGVRPCVTAKLPVLRPGFWNLILLNLAAASCYFIAFLVGRTSLQRLKVAAHVLVKSWFAAPLPCTFQCFVRKVKNASRR